MNAVNVRLYRAELRRIARRRATIVTVSLLLALLAFAGAKTFVTSSADPPDLARAERLAGQQMAECRTAVTSDGSSFTERELTDMCFVDPMWLLDDPAYHLQSLLSGNGSESWDVMRAGATERTSYPIDVEGTMRVNPAPGFGGDLVSFIQLVTFVAMALGASYIGSDFRTGVAESQAVWMPNRRRLAAVKLAGVGTAAGLLVLGASILSVVVLLPSAVWRGDTSGTGPAFWADVAATVGRGVLATTLLALLAGAIALATRSTVAGIVGLVGWAFVTSLFATQFGSWVAYLSPTANLEAFVRRGDVTFLERIPLPAGGIESFTAVSHSWLTAGFVVAVVVALAAAVGGASFVRRDIS